MDASDRVLTFVLAGGEGKRLYPLTRDRAKPAVPFGGVFRLIDFALSNLVNAGYRRIAVLTQYKSNSLNRHLTLTWQLTPLLGSYVTPVPAQMRSGPHWYAGSADAIFQNLNLMDDERPEHVLVFGADHVYRMDPEQMMEQHLASRAAVTIAAIRVPIGEASAFGVIEADSGGRVTGFREKPTDPEPLPDDPGRVYASMGNYVFSALALRQAAIADAEDPESRHDIGGDLLPKLVAEGQAFVYDFMSNRVPGQTERERGYWRDVGTLDAFYESHMDLVSVDPTFDLYNAQWPIYAYQPPLPPAKFVFEEPGRVGQALDSMVASGVIVSGATVRRSVLSPGVHLHSRSLVEESVLMDGVDVGRGAVVRRAIIDKGTRIAPGVRIGIDPEADMRRFTVSARGVVVIGKNENVGF